MSLSNIGKVINAKNDASAITSALLPIKKLNDAAGILNKYTTLGKDDKKSILTSLFGEDESSDISNVLSDVADNVADIGDAASDSFPKITKLKDGLTAVTNSALKFISAHKGLTIAGGITAAAVIAYNAYKDYEDGLVEAAHKATSEWDSSLSDIQSQMAKYKELKEQLESGDLSQAETITVKQQILDIQNKITESYGAQADGIDLINGKLDTQLAKMEAISSKQASENLDNHLSEYKNAESKILENRSYNIGGFTKSVGGLGENSNYAKSIEDVEKIVDKFDNLDIEQARGTNSKTYSIKFNGTATEADETIHAFTEEIRKLQKTYGKNSTVLSSILTNSSSALSKNNEIIDRYEDDYKAYLEQQIYSNDNGKLLVDYSNSISNLNSALIEDDSEKIHETVKAYYEAKKAKEEFLSTDDNEKFSFIFEDIDDTLNETSLKYFDFIEAISDVTHDNNQFKDQEKDLKELGEQLKKTKIDAVDVKNALQTDGYQTGEKYIRKLAEAYGYIANKMDATDISSFADLLADAGLVASASTSNVNALADAIEEVTNRSSLLYRKNGIHDNPLFDKIAEAGESKNAGDDYVSMITNLKTAKDLYDKGLVGTDDFKTIAAYLSPTQSEDPANFKENYKKASRYLKENATGVENFLKDLEKKGYATSETLVDGTKQWTYSIEDLDEAAQNMGMGFEFFMDMFGRAEDYGAHNNFVSSIEDGAERVVDLTTQLVKEEAKLKEMETTGQYTTIDENGNKTKTMANQTALDAQRKTVQALKNDIEETQKAMDVLTERDAESYNKQVDSAKQSIEALNEERKRILEDNEYGDNTDSVDQLMQAQIKAWAEENKITLDADLNIVEPDENPKIEIDIDHENIDDIRKAAEKSIDAVQKLISETSDTKLDLDDNNIRHIDNQISSVSYALGKMADENGVVSIETEGVQDTINVLSALYLQRQKVTGKVLMSIDTEQIDEDVASVIDKLQRFHQAYSELQTLNSLSVAGVDVDTTAAEEKLKNVQNELVNLEGNEAEIYAKIIPDSSSALAIEEGIGQIEVDALVKDFDIPEDTLIKVNAEVEGKDEAESLSSIIKGIPEEKTSKLIAEIHDGGLGNYVFQLNTIPSKKTTIIEQQYKTVMPTYAPLSKLAKKTGTFAMAYASGSAYNVQNYKPLSTAYATGNVALPENERALVNEEYLNGHSESIVRNGVWSLIPGGAHFENLKKGDIVFSAKQTEDLLKSGATPGHARAYASGSLSVNAYSVSSLNGGVNFGQGGSGSQSGAKGTSKKSSTKSNTKSTDANTKATEDNTEAQENLQDWISRLTDNMKDWNDTFKDAIDQFEMNYNQNRAIDEYVANSESYKQNLRNAANTYMSKANSLGLSGGYIHKIWNGTMEIEDIQDENLREKIEKYTEWYDKARSLNAEIAEINQSIKETKIKKLENIKDDYDNLVNLSTSISDYNESVSDLAEKLNGVGDANALLSSMNAQLAIRQALVNSEAQLNAQLNALVADGTIGLYTDTWNQWKEEINDVKKSIIEADEALNELKQSIIEIRFDSFTKSIDNLDFKSDISSSIQDLLSDEGIYDDNVRITSEGYTKLGLMGADLVDAKQKVANYNEAIRALNENYVQGNISQADFNEKLQEYQKEQMDAVSATKKARDAIIDLIKEGIEKETEAMDELISKRKEDLDKQKEYYDFQKKMTDQTKEMNKLRAQLASLEGDDSIEATAKRRKLESQLRDLQETYDENQKDHERDVVSEAYDKTLEDFTENQDKTLKELETSLDKQNKAIADALEATKNNYGDVYSVLTELSNQYNFTLTDSLVNPWLSAENAVKQYQDAVNKLDPNISIDSSKINTSAPSSSATVPTKNESKYVTTKNQNGTWLNQNGRWWYQHNDGGWTNNGWENIDGSWYKFDKQGWMQTGWQPWGTDSTGNTAWYYLNTSGAMAKSTWIAGKNGEQYYVDSSGVMARNGYVRSADGSKYYWVNANGVWEPKWTTANPNLSKYKLYYSSGTPKGKNQLGFMDDIDGKLQLGSEALITEKGVLGNWGNNVIFSQEQTQRLFEMSNGNFAGLDGMLKNVKTSLPMDITNTTNQGDINIHYDNLINVEGDVNKEMFPGIEVMLKKGLDYNMKQLKKYAGRLK